MRVSAPSLRMAVWASLLVFAASLHAEEAAHAKTAAAAKKPAVAKSTAVSTVRERGAVRGASSGPLTEAYRLMQSADHDYKGHRAAAMRHVAEAARLIGERVIGRSSAHEEAQGASDGQLQQAQSLLQGASSHLGGAALQQVEEAISQLSIALSVR